MRQEAIERDIGATYATLCAIDSFTGELSTLYDWFGRWGKSVVLHDETRYGDCYLYSVEAPRSAIDELPQELIVQNTIFQP